ncbi:MAG: hypothetical protein DRH10_00280 [Deltaproteobacteria bacterium]|mgnify:CR=1 FL=1|nr:MAG: hypothetical protein DRH50_11440 [Deltaproteobacteria bacterium]RLB92072.1 MAG: hypothetical protein DRH10_00280 [Deltaproteobacteria bacterium]RLC12231.1 MAG: hypothetical protein DRH43_02175 [Deltaproteobacteria bacterium]
MQAKAPAPVFALELIAISTRFTKTVEVAFFALFSAYDGCDDFSKTRRAKGRGEIVGFPGNRRLLFPLFTASNALNT